MGRSSPEYEPRSPAQGALYEVVRDHFETFRAEAAGAHERGGLPRFIEEEFRGYLRCGSLAGGFARFRCERCGLDRLVPFSCKGRAVCPSCGGRRMAERAAHLVDQVFPLVPVRQWVLSVPFDLRYVLAWDHALCRAVTGVFVRAVLGSLRRRARQQGVSGGRSGAVAIIQRFGGALNLNVHVHALVLDGVYVEDGCGALRFHAAAPPPDEEMDRLITAIDRRIHRLLVRRGVLDDFGDGAAADAWREEEPVLAGIAAASVQGRRALGEQAGATVVRCGASAERSVLAPSGLGPCHAQWRGFDLHAAVVVAPRDRARLERLCRYALSPPVAQDRLRLTPEGRVVLDLRHAWADGTTHLVFEPLELLERLAALIPRPRINLLLYLGVLGARSAWRARLRESEPEQSSASSQPAPGGESRSVGAIHSHTNWLWAELMRRSFGFDVLACPAAELVSHSSHSSKTRASFGASSTISGYQPMCPPPVPRSRHRSHTPIRGPTMTWPCPESRDDPPRVAHEGALSGGASAMGVQRAVA